MARQFDRKLILEDGSQYYGYGFGATCDRVCEIAFHTSMSGYQEIVTDPSAAGMALVMTYPLIGGSGITDEDFESRTPSLGALIVGGYCDNPSNFRSIKTLAEILEENDIPAMEGLDTRKLARHLRDNGNCRCLITGVETTLEEGLKIIAETPIRKDQVARVSCRKRWYSRTPDHLFNVVVVDCGTKLSVVRTFNKLGCNVTVMPWDSDAETILAAKPDGILISDGPGDPADASRVCEVINRLKGKLPIFGTGLGHQLIAMAYGAKVVAMKSGHRGGTYPVRNLTTGKIEITSQFHGFVVDEASLENTGLSVTHTCVVDGSVEGLACKEDNIFSVQYYPESAPGPQDSAYLFDMFITAMKEEK
jgi:carbamoyl-phosphate synthase small subunit